MMGCGARGSLLRRWLIRLVAVLVFGVGVGSAQAVVKYRATGGQYNVNITEYSSSKDAACAAYYVAAQVGRPGGWGGYRVYVDGVYDICEVVRYGSEASVLIGSIDEPGLCLLGMEPGPDGHCVCKAGTHQVGEACFPNTSELEEFCKSHALPKNTFNQRGTIGVSSPTPQSSCYKPYPPFEGADANKGCEMTLRDMVKAPGEDGLMNWSGTGTPTGATCEDAAATDEKPKAEDDKCVGGFSGTVNGVQKCIPAEPDKGIEGVKTGTVTDADGTKHEIKEETKCEGTQCTTTTTTKTTTTSGTTTTTTKSETQSLTDKCAKDPSNKVCTKTNGGTGGAGSPTGCAANSSGAGCGGAGAGIGGLYEGKDATVQGIMDKAVADLKGSGIGGAVGSFFTVPGGGSAPSMVWNIPYFNVTVSPPGLNSEVAMAIYPVLKGVLLLVASFIAFRIAVDN